MGIRNARPMQIALENKCNLPFGSGLDERVHGNRIAVIVNHPVQKISEVRLVNVQHVYDSLTGDSDFLPTTFSPPSARRANIRVWMR